MDRKPSRSGAPLCRLDVHDRARVWLLRRQRWPVRACGRGARLGNEGRLLGDLRLTGAAWNCTPSAPRPGIAAALCEYERGRR